MNASDDSSCSSSSHRRSRSHSPTQKRLEDFFTPIDYDISMLPSSESTAVWASSDMQSILVPRRSVTNTFLELLSKQKKSWLIDRTSTYDGKHYIARCQLREVESNLMHVEGFESQASFVNGWTRGGGLEYLNVVPVKENGELHLDVTYCSYYVS